MHTKRVCPKLSDFEIWCEVFPYRSKSTDQVWLETYLPDIKVKRYRTYRANRKVVENARIKFFNQSLLHPVVFYKRKLQIFVSSFISCSLQWRGRLHYECVSISALNTTLEIYLLLKNGHKSTQTRCKVCSNLTKCTTTIDFRLTIVVFTNLEYLSHPTLVLRFILWKGECWIKVRRELFCQNNVVMLTCWHSHSPGILLWQCSCHRN